MKVILKEIHRSRGCLVQNLEAKKKLIKGVLLSAIVQMTVDLLLSIVRLGFLRVFFSGGELP